jgi:hypothetical protein
MSVTRLMLRCEIFKEIPYAHATTPAMCGPTSTRPQVEVISRVEERRTHEDFFLVCSRHNIMGSSSQQLCYLLVILAAAIVNADVKY